MVQDIVVLEAPQKAGFDANWPLFYRNVLKLHLRTGTCKGIFNHVIEKKEKIVFPNRVFLCGQAKACALIRKGIL
jgi:hypothetical protein